MEVQVKKFIKGFDEAFKEFIKSEYTEINSGIISKGIEWYNANLMMIGINNLCPVSIIEEHSIHTYMWAYSCGLCACANIKGRLY